MQNHSQTQKSPNRNLLGLISAIVILAVALMSAIGAFIVARQLTLKGSIAAGNPDLTGLNSTPLLNEQGTPMPASVGEMGATDPLAVGEQLTPWDGAGRVTLLLLGVDYRDWEAQSEAARSDTMILLTLDPQTKTAGILSVPRDLWVAIPGFQHGKINTAYYLGDAYKLPGGGPALAIKTVESLLGVPINYYAQVDFGAFINFIDEIGGVKIDVPAPITIDLLGTGPKTKKKIQAGKQTLPGEWALAYARSRYTEGGDFDRARRQQQVIMSIRDKVVDVKTLPKLIEKAPTLYEQLASGIRTNLTLDQVIKLALLAKDVPEESIKKGVIDKGDVYFANSPDGLSILIPIPDDIQILRDEIFASSGSLGPQTAGNSQERLKNEAARIILYNGSGDPSLADRTAEYLRSQGANIIQVSAASQSYAATTLVDHTGSPYAIKYLMEWMNIAPGRFTIQFDMESQVDVELFIGADWAAKNSLP